MAKNDDRRRKMEAGGKGLSIVLTKEAQDALVELRAILRQRGEPSSQEATTCRALIWAATAFRKGKEPPTSSVVKAITPAHDQPHETAHEPSLSLADRMTELEGRMTSVEAAMVGGVQPGQWGGL